MSRVFTIVAVYTSVLGAQTFTGTVLGTVRDPSGAVTPGATLTLINVNTNEKRSQIGKADGGFLFVLIPPGSYQLEAEMAGFKKFVRTNLNVEVQQTAVVDVSLEVGAASESVQVTGETPLLQPATSSLGQVVDNRKIVEFPLAGRNTFA